MKIPSVHLTLLLLCSSCFALGARAADSPKKVLVVTVTTGFRHSSIPLSEKIIRQLAEKSGAFTVDFVEQPPGKPALPKRPAPLKPGASAEQQAAYQAALQAASAGEKAQAGALIAWDEKLKGALQKLSPENLKNYDAVIFDSTTGDLPIPDKPGFLDWIKEGHAFIGIHAATDTFHGWPEYLDMVGGEFVKHGAQIAVECINMDPKHPATAHLPQRWPLNQEEIYNFRGYDSSKVHELLTLDRSPLDKSPGHYPIAWCKMYGAGRVFYTALGHREDLWDTDPALPGRKNSPEMAAQFQQMIARGNRVGPRPAVWRRHPAENPVTRGEPRVAFLVSG